MDIDDNTNNLIARWYLGERPERAFADWAIERIENCFDGKHLRVLSSMFTGKGSREQFERFLLVLKESEQILPEIHECLYRYCDFVAQGIVSEETESNLGWQAIIEVANTLLSPARLRRWQSLSSTLYVEEIPEHEKSALIRETAE